MKLRNKLGIALLCGCLAMLFAIVLITPNPFTAPGGEFLLTVILPALVGIVGIVLLWLSYG